LEQPNNNNEHQRSINDSVFSAQVNILHANLLTSVPANFICAFIVFISLFQSQNKTVITGWFAAVLLVSLFRIGSLYFYRRHPRSDNWHLSIFIVGVGLSALLWGAVNSVFMPPEDLMHQMVVIVITAGVTAGGTQTLNANVKASLLYVVIIFVPLTVWLFLQGSFVYSLLGIAMIAYIGFMALTALRGNKLLVTTLTLQYENQALVEKISISNSKLLDYSKTLYQQSTHDSLTGLFNRRYLDETLARELQYAIRERQTLCVAMLDLDFFKSFNDTYGHAAGDEMLKFVGALMNNTFRKSDICCRFGGEEFLVILVNADTTFAEDRLDHFRQVVKQGIVTFQGKVLPPMTVSIGIAEAPRQGASVEDIIHAADIALYSAKKAGRDRIERASVNVTVA